MGDINIGGQNAFNWQGRKGRESPLFTLNHGPTIANVEKNLACVTILEGEGKHDGNNGKASLT